MTDAERLEDCGECGQRVGVVERHTFVDCSLYAANHRGSLALPGKYAKALGAEVERLRGVVEAVGALHFAYVGSVPTIGGDALYTECQACQVDWPCETHVALAELEGKG